MTIQLFLDCDGVLADFDAGAKRVLGLAPRAFEQRHGQAEFWRRLAAAPGSYASLPLIPDATRLFSAVKHLDPVILTGCPRGGWAEPQKVRWAEKHFPGTRIITCMAVDKHRHRRAGDILVVKHRLLWEGAGGAFVHHRSAEPTIDALATLGLAVRHREIARR